MSEEKRDQAKTEPAEAAAAADADAMPGGRLRRPYGKPELDRVRLVVEEAVLASCKAPGGGGGPTRNNCKLPGNTPCIDQTS